MAVVSFDSAKGGVGKTTLAVNVAAELAYNGIATIVLDCDVNQHATQFGSVFCPLNPDLPVRFVGGVSKTNVVQMIREAEGEADVVIIDLPAGTSELSLRALMKSQLAVIPAQKTVFDVRDAARTAMQIADAEELSNQRIYSALVWSMVKARKETRTERAVRESFLSMITDPERAVLRAPMLEYDAFPAGFVYSWVPRQFADRPGQAVRMRLPGGGSAEFVVPASVPKAAENMAAITSQILSRLGDIAANRDPGRVSLKPEILERMRRNPETEAA